MSFAFCGLLLLWDNDVGCISGNAVILLGSMASKDNECCVEWSNVLSLPSLVLWYRAAMESLHVGCQSLTLIPSGGNEQTATEQFPGLNMWKVIHSSVWSVKFDSYPAALPRSCKLRWVVVLTLGPLPCSRIYHVIFVRNRLVQFN